MALHSELEQFVDDLKSAFNETMISSLEKELAVSTHLIDKINEAYAEFKSQSSQLLAEEDQSAYLYEKSNYNRQVRKLIMADISASQSLDYQEAVRECILKSYSIIESYLAQADVARILNKIVQAARHYSWFGRFTHKSISKIHDLFLFRKKADIQIQETLKSSGQDTTTVFFFYYLIVENFNKNGFHFDPIFKANSELLQYYYGLDNGHETALLELEAAGQQTDTHSNSFNTEKDKVLRRAIKDASETFSAAYFDSIVSFLELGKNQGQKNSDTNPLPCFPVYHNLAKDSSEIARHFSKHFRNWHNTIYLLAEDWTLNLEIDSLIFSFQKEYHDFSLILHSRLNLPFVRQLSELKELIKSASSSISGQDELSGPELAERIGKLRAGIKLQLVSQKLPGLKEIIEKLNLPAIIDQVQQDSMKEFQGISRVNVLMKNARYDVPMPNSVFEKISPFELINYKMVPEFIDTFPHLKTAFINYFQGVQQRLNEIPDIVDFSLNSAMRKFEQEKTTAVAIEIAQKGLNRTEIKLASLLDFHRAFIDNELRCLKKPIENLIKEISEIKENDNALQIKLWVTRHKAIEKSKAFRDRILIKIKNSIPVAHTHGSRIFSFLKASSQKITDQLKVDKAKHFIASDVSDFLVATESTIAGLPYVYQQLFKIEALSSFEFYYERPIVWGKLDRAYQKWQEGKYAPVALVGEKGSGKTTLIHKFLSQEKIREKIVYKDFNAKHLKIEDFYNELEAEVLAMNGGRDNSQFPENKIIAVDGLEQLFSIRINGFVYVHKLLQLISMSYQRAFWIFGCHSISWDYLEKTMALSDFFGYTIKLSEFSVDELQQLIARRHHISGYRMGFVNHQKKKSFFHFKKMDEVGLQKILKYDYFSKLQRSAKGNITQAFLFWLISACQIEEDIIYFDQELLPEYNFFKSINKNKLLIMRAILIENGLTVDNLKDIIRCEHESARLKLDQLLDDGLLVKRDTIYYINPFVYRQVVDELYSINMLH